MLELMHLSYPFILGIFFTLWVRQVFNLFKLFTSDEEITMHTQLGEAIYSVVITALMMGMFVLTSLTAMNYYSYLQY